MIELGQKVRDRITGAEGIAVGRTDWLYGCRTVTVKPTARKDDGSLADNLHFDEPQLEVVGRGLSAQGEQARVTSPHTGGPERAITNTRGT